MRNIIGGIPALVSLQISTFVYTFTIALVIGYAYSFVFAATPDVNAPAWLAICDLIRGFSLAAGIYTSWRVWKRLSADNQAS